MGFVFVLLKDNVRVLRFFCVVFSAFPLHPPEMDAMKVEKLRADPTIYGAIDEMTSFRILREGGG